METKHTPKFRSLDDVIVHLVAIRDDLWAEYEVQEKNTRERRAVLGNPYMSGLNARAGGLNEAIEVLRLFQITLAMGGDK